jgi:hypothetical protein
MRYLMLKIQKFHFRKKIYAPRYQYFFILTACTKHFPKNGLISHLYFMSSSEIISPEVKHRRKILTNQLPVILEANIRNKFRLFFGNRIKILFNVFERKDSTILFFALLKNIDTHF